MPSLSHPTSTMPEISLRTYVKQLDNLIERKQIDETVAHCRHILQLYPKHVDTYRMLGKALLEKGRHGDAADIFQRVLSVLPDDFIANVGMAIVREDEANLEDAIWHMERAFEAMPSNGAIQQELCRLLGRRDGVVPPRARLTRGALARMYLNGGLYLQAEAELKQAIAEDSGRMDLLTTLAQVYWHGGQAAAAADACASALERLPYSLHANRILAAVFAAAGRDAEASTCRQRAVALDPYEAFTDLDSPGSAAEVDEDAVRLLRLDYVPGSDDMGQPDWIAAIGARFEDPRPSDSDETPAWLTQAEPEPSRSPQPVALESADIPEWLASIRPDEAQQTAGAGTSGDWMSGLNLAGSQPEAEELPDWLREAAEPEATRSILNPAHTSVEVSEDEPAAVPDLTGTAADDALPDWMRPAVGQASNAAFQMDAPGTDESLPNWLAETDSGEDAWRAPADNAIDSNADALGLARADVPEWLAAAPPPDLSQARPTETGPDEANTDWMLAPEPHQSAGMANAEFEAVGEPAPSDAAGSVDLPEWLRSSLEADAQQQVVETPEPGVGDAPPDADATLIVGVVGAPAGTDAEEPADDEEAEPTLTTEMPEWLRAAASAAPPPDAGDPGWAPASETHEAPPAIGPAVELPDYLQPASPEAIARAEQPFDNSDEAFDDDLTDDDSPPALPAELPDWLRALAPLSADPQPQGEAKPDDDFLAAISQAAADMAVPGDDDPLPWLEGLPAATTPPAAGAPGAEGELPEWLAAATGDSGLAQASSEEVPDWLKATQGDAPANEQADTQAGLEEAPAAAETAAQAVDLPGWARPDEPGSTDTVTNWLASQDVPEWLRKVREAAADVPIIEAAGSKPAEELESSSPERPAMDASLAVPEELAEDAIPPTLSESALERAQFEPSLPAASAVEAPAAPEHAEGWLSDMEAALPGERLEDTTPHKLMSGLVTSEPAEAEEADTPESLAAPGDVEVAVDNMTAEQARQWLEAQGIAPPVAAEAADAEAGPSEAPAVDLGAMDADEALRFLEALAARQGAPADELLTAPEDRLADVPAWAVAPVAEAEGGAPADQSASVPEWLRDIPVPSDGAPAAADDLEAPLDAGSDWLAEARAAGEREAAALEAAEPDDGGGTEAPLDEAATMPAATMPAATMPAATVPAPGEIPAWLASVEEEVAAPAEPVAVPEWQAMSEAPPAQVDETSEAEAQAEALAWLESLAARQGASSDSLLTNPEERPDVPPAWVAAEAAAAVTADQSLDEPAPEGTEPTPVPEALAAQPAGPPPTAEPPDVVIGDHEKLSRLADRLASARRAKEAEIEARFADRRSAEETARRLVQERMQAQRAAMEAATAGRKTEAAPTGPAEPPAPAPLRVVPKVRRQPSPYAGQPAESVLAQARQSLAAADFDTAAWAFEHLIESGSLGEADVREIEAAAASPAAPARLLQVLGDVYARDDRLQKALDTYRLALKRL
jgi:tetratricopeptide (TPR) repeat protein